MELYARALARRSVSLRCSAWIRYGEFRTGHPLSSGYKNRRARKQLPYTLTPKVSLDLRQEFDLLSDHDLMQVQDAVNAMSATVTLVLYSTGADSAFEANLANIAAQVNGVSMGQVRLDEGREPVIPGKASLTLSAKLQRNIHYLAAPEGHEFESFCKGIRWLGGADKPLTSELREKLNGLTEPVDLLVPIASACNHCPHVVQTALAVAVVQPLITLTIIDALQFPDMAERFNVKSVPTIIINATRTIVGRIEAEGLVNELVTVEGTKSLTDDLESMISSGRAEDAAALLCKRKEPQAILPLYVSNEFATRLGALVTIEEALGRDPRILDPVLDDLSRLLFHEDVGLRGDTADLLGRIGNPAAIPWLRKALDDPDLDVREAVEEALQRLG